MRRRDEAPVEPAAPRKVARSARGEQALVVRGRGAGAGAAGAGGSGESGSLGAGGEDGSSGPGGPAGRGRSGAGSAGSTVGAGSAGTRAGDFSDAATAGDVSDAAAPRDLSDAATPLAAVLREQGRRLVWVAARLGVDPSTVSRWCSGDRPIPGVRLRELAAVLGVSVDVLTPLRGLADPSGVFEPPSGAGWPFGGV